MLPFSISLALISTVVATPLDQDLQKRLHEPQIKRNRYHSTPLKIEITKQFGEYENATKLIIQTKVNELSSDIFLQSNNSCQAGRLSHIPQDEEGSSNRYCAFHLLVLRHSSPEMLLRYFKIHGMFPLNSLHADTPEFFCVYSLRRMCHQHRLSPVLTVAAATTVCYTKRDFQQIKKSKRTLVTHGLHPSETVAWLFGGTIDFSPLFIGHFGRQKRRAELLASAFALNRR